MLPSAKYDIVGDPDVHLRVSGFVGEVEEAGRRGVDDIGDAKSPRVLPPEVLLNRGIVAYGKL